jgi:DNA repair protein RadC
MERKPHYLGHRRQVRERLRAHAAMLVFAYNHPSGDLTPSEMDRILTRSLMLAAQAMSMAVYDHPIVSRGGHFSFREHKLL